VTPPTEDQTIHVVRHTLFLLIGRLSLSGMAHISVAPLSGLIDQDRSVHERVVESSDVSQLVNLMSLFTADRKIKR